MGICVALVCLTRGEVGARRALRVFQASDRDALCWQDARMIQARWQALVRAASRAGMQADAIPYYQASMGGSNEGRAGRGLAWLVSRGGQALA